MSVWLSMADSAHLLGVTVGTLRRWIRAGHVGRRGEYVDHVAAERVRVEMEQRRRAILRQKCVG